jgi:Fur family ferric uptake transcriptional regulator
MQNEYRVSLATVYNTLDLLLDCGLIIKHPFVSQSAQYEKTFGNVIHSHLICTKCGSIKEFSDKKIRKAIQSKTFTSFDVSHYSLYLYGLCKVCRTSRKK